MSKTKAQLEAENLDLTAKVEKLEYLVEELKTSIPQKPTLFRRGITFVKSNWKGMAIGAVLAAALMLPFVSAGNPFRKLNRFNPVNVLKADSPALIAKESPNDPTKRQTIASAYRSTANLIREKAITETWEAKAAIKTETTNVRHAPAWKPTTDRLNRLIDPIADLDSLADKLHEIAEAFDQ